MPGDIEMGAGALQAPSPHPPSGAAVAAILDPHVGNVVNFTDSPHVDVSFVHHDLASVVWYIFMQLGTAATERQYAKAIEHVLTERGPPLWRAVNAEHPIPISFETPSGLDKLLGTNAADLFVTVELDFDDSPPRCYNIIIELKKDAPTAAVLTGAIRQATDYARMLRQSGGTVDMVCGITFPKSSSANPVPAVWVVPLPPVATMRDQ